MLVHARIFWFGGMWIFPLLFFAAFLLIICAIFRKGFGRPIWLTQGTQSGEGRDSVSPLEILKKRYAGGEITKEEFENIRKDLLS